MAPHIISQSRTGVKSSPDEGIHPADEPPASSQDDNDIIESQWGVGWRTLGTVFLFYLLAVVAAVAHLVLFIQLDGRPLDDSGTIRQTYVAVLSTLFVTIFRASLAASIGVASTQHIWRLLRTKAMSISTIEGLFAVRSSPSNLLLTSGGRRGQRWLSAPLVYLAAAVILAVSGAIIFPPGALTVVSVPFVSEGVAFEVPTFEPAYVGNGTTADVEAHALGEFTILSSSWRYVGLHPVLRRIASSTLSTGEIASAASPCGLNCSYSITFPGPHFTCSETESVVVQPRFYLAGTMPVYRHFWAESNHDAGTVPTRLRTPGGGESPPAEFPSFHVGLSRLMGKPVTENGNSDTDIVAETHELECRPGTATYEVRVTFVNGSRSLSYSTRDDDASLSEQFDVDVTPPRTDEIPGDGGSEFRQVWTDQRLTNLRITNIYAIFDSLMQALAGDYPMYSGLVPRTDGSVSDQSDEQTVTLSNGTAVAYSPRMESFSLTYTSRLAPNRTIIASTYFNHNRDSLDVTASPNITISPALLNEAVANITLSAVFSFPYWTAPAADARTSVNRNVYSFSGPVNLTVPYGASLLLALPFLLVGMLALRSNGVPAADGSFTQILVTTAASRRLNALAAGGGLGGEANVPERLKSQRVRFGEVVEKEGGGKRGSREWDMLLRDGGHGEDLSGGTVRRAGFGLEDEVVPLMKGSRYGTLLPRDVGGAEKVGHR